MTNKFDVVLIGSGVSSLTAAILLAEQGRSVCVLEKTTKPGGYLHCFSRFGTRFDTGAHYLGALDEGQAFHSLLNVLGVYDSSLFIPLDASGFDHFHFPHFELKMPKGYGAFLENLLKVFPLEERAIIRFLAEVQKAVQNFQTYHFAEEIDSMALLKSMETSLASMLDQCGVRNVDLKRVLTAYCALHGTSAEDTPFGMHAVIMDSFLIGPYGFRQGGDAVAQAFVKRLKALGGELKLRCEMKEIVIEGGEVAGVITANEEFIGAKVVIAGIHPKHTLKSIRDKAVFSPAFVKRVENMRESIGIFGVYAKTQFDPGRSLLKNEYYFSSKEDVPLNEIGDFTQLPKVVFMSSSQREMKENTHNSFNILAACEFSWFKEWEHSKYGKRPEEYKNLKASFSERVLDVIEEFEPTFRGGVEGLLSSSPLSNQFFNPSPEGSAYGIYHSIDNTGARALGPRTKIPSLLLTGQNTLFPGIMGASVAGLRTAGHLIGIKPLIRRLREFKESHAGEISL